MHSSRLFVVGDTDQSPERVLRESPGPADGMDCHSSNPVSVLVPPLPADESHSFHSACDEYLGHIGWPFSSMVAHHVCQGRRIDWVYGGREGAPVGR